MLSKLNHLQETAKRAKKFTLIQAAELSEAFDQDLQVITDAINNIGGVSVGGSTYKQVTKLNVEAPKSVDITVPYTKSFIRPPIEVLKFLPSDEDSQLVTVCDFDNGDSDDFVYDERYVEFDGTMHLKTKFDVVSGSLSTSDTTVYNSIAMSEPVAFGSGLISTSAIVDMSQYSNIKDIIIKSNTIGHTLTATGNTYGKWSLDTCSLILLADNNAAYDSAGNKLADDWSALSDSQKVSAFNSAQYGDIATAAKNLGSVQFLLYQSEFANPELKIVTSSDNIQPVFTQSTNAALENGFVSISDLIDASSFKTIDDIVVSSGEISVTLKSTGSTYGTWTIDFGSFTMLLLDENYAVYDCGGTKLADSWIALSDEQKIAAINSATGNSFVTVALSLGKFRILAYSADDYLAQFTLYAIPKSQFVLPNGLIDIKTFENIYDVVVAANCDNNSIAKFAVTPDLEHYYIFENNAWAKIDIPDDIASKGMSIADLANITALQWKELTDDTEKVGFAYALSLDAIDDTLYVDKIILTGDLKGWWNKAVHGTDYTYGYNTNSNLRVQLLTDGSYKINYGG